MVLVVWSITKEEDRIPLRSSPTPQTKITLDEVLQIKVMTIEIAKGNRG